MSFLFYDIILFVAFCTLAVVFLRRNKKNVKREGIIYLYKSGFGIKLMDSIVKHARKFLNFISVYVVIIGFIGMAAMIFLLIASAYKMATIPIAIKTPPVVPLLPWIPFPGLPTLYFTYWIIAIFLLAVVHEGCHGIFSRLNDIKIKSTGFGFLGPLPLAFVEPDEKQMAKKGFKAQLSILAAGPVSNFALAALVFLLITAVINPVYSKVENSSILVVQVNESGPAYASGIREGDVIKIENASTLKEYSEIYSSIKPNQTITIEKNGEKISLITVVNPLNESLGSVGIAVTPKLSGISRIAPYIPSTLIFWIFMTNLFVGLFNLLPLPIVDGGRMAYIASLYFTKSDKRAKKIAKRAYTFSLSLFVLLFVIWILRIL